MKFAKLILKNVLRNKRRTLLTVSSLVVSLFLIVSLATILTEFERGSDEANPSRVVTRHSVSLGFLLPMSDLQRIEAIEGVKAVSPLTWFGGIYIDEKNFFANFAADAKKLKEIYPEVKMTDAEWEAFTADRQGAIVGRKLVTLYGFTPGQRITLKSPIYNQDVEFIVRGVYAGSDEKTLFFHHEYLNELAPEWAKDHTGLFSILAFLFHPLPYNVFQGLLLHFPSGSYYWPP
jgi:putative ABC transport system permease protein